MASSKIFIEYLDNGYIVIKNGKKTAVSSYGDLKKLLKDEFENMINEVGSIADNHRIEIDVEKNVPVIKPAAHTS